MACLVLDHPKNAFAFYGLKPIAYAKSIFYVLKKSGENETSY